jgi:hypothetical protein
MRTWIKIASVLALTMGILSVASRAGSGGSEAFEKLKALVGHWESTGAKDKSTLDIELTGGGTAVLERSHETVDGKAVEMTTVYYLDGDKVRLTHYCMAGNQPTMQGTFDATAKTIKFDFVGATNLKSANDGHMHHAVYTFVDNDHVKMAWTFRKDQKDTFTEDVTYARK